MQPNLQWRILHSLRTYLYTTSDTTETDADVAIELKEEKIEEIEGEYDITSIAETDLIQIE